jgi:surfactin synthase thioesterase subunit
MNTKKVKIYYLGGGNSTDVTVVCRAHLQKMQSLGYQTEVYDTPGHGSQLSTITNIDSWAQHVFEHITLQEDKEDKIFLFGVSLAGHIVFRVARLFQQHGKTVFPIVQGSPPKTFDLNVSEPLYIPLTEELKRAFPLLAKDHFTYEDAKLFVECQFTKEFVHDHPELIAECIQSAKNTKLRGEFVSSLFSSNFDEMAAVIDHPQPFLIIHGADDAGVNLKYLNIIPTQNLYKNKVHVLSGGHQLASSNPDQFTQLITDFIEDCIVTLH